MNNIYWSEQRQTGGVGRQRYHLDVSRLVERRVHQPFNQSIFDRMT